MAPGEPVALLFVDGYNIIGAWPQLMQVRDHDGFELARHHLVEALTSYAAYQSFETRLVFDAYAQQTPMRQETVTDQLSVHYTAFGETADSCIERWCAQLRHHSQRRIVATSDRAQQLTVMGYGAEWMSAHQLAQDVTTLAQSQRRQRQRQRQTAPKRALFHSLSPEAQAKLHRMRFGSP